jgi:hypothetical protein
MIKDPRDTEDTERSKEKTQKKWYGEELKEKKRNGDEPKRAE